MAGRTISPITSSHSCPALTTITWSSPPHTRVASTWRPRWWCMPITNNDISSSNSTRVRAILFRSRRLRRRWRACRTTRCRRPSRATQVSVGVTTTMLPLLPLLLLLFFLLLLLLLLLWVLACSNCTHHYTHRYTLAAWYRGQYCCANLWL